MSHQVGSWVDVFETVIYAIAFLLLVAAAVLVVIGGESSTGCSSSWVRWGYW